jgi:hypothetical protein
LNYDLQITLELATPHRTGGLWESKVNISPRSAKRSSRACGKHEKKWLGDKVRKIKKRKLALPKWTLRSGLELVTLHDRLES